MKFNKKELEVLNLLLDKSREGVELFKEPYRKNYTISIYGKARAKALNTAMDKIFKHLKETTK